jgi:hypothetical protein
MHNIYRHVEITNRSEECRDVLFIFEIWKQYLEHPKLNVCE